MTTMTNYLLPLLAQVGEPGFEAFRIWISHVLILIGIALIAYGGWMIGHNGETGRGSLAIIGGFILVAAVPIVNAFARMNGVTP